MLDILRSTTAWHFVFVVPPFAVLGGSRRAWVLGR
jgi:hypothetical protein